jgi:hypothetical protein
MARYQYRCPSCKQEKEVQHSMSEFDNPSEETARQITCNENTCTYPINDHAVFGLAWKTVPTVPNLMYFGTGTHDKGGMKTLEEKSKYAKNRATTQSNKEGLPDRKKEDAERIKNEVKGK